MVEKILKIYKETKKVNIAKYKKQIQKLKSFLETNNFNEEILILLAQRLVKKSKNFNEFVDEFIEILRDKRIKEIDEKFSAHDLYAYFMRKYLSLKLNFPEDFKKIIQQNKNRNIDFYILNKLMEMDK